MSNAEINRFLDELNEHTNALAAAATVQAEKIGEISADIDDLIANGGGLDDATRARLEAMKTTLAGIAEAENAQAAHLTEIATKHDAPLPELPAAAAGKTRKARK